MSFDLVNELRKYTPVDDTDEQQAWQIRLFVQENTQCFERWFTPAHITGSAFVVNSTLDHVLLTHHKKLGLWLQVGGHADGNPNVQEVALREAREESGIETINVLSENIFDVDIHHIPKHGDDPEHFHYDIRFLFQAPTDEPLKISHESNDLVWAPIRDITDFSTEESFLRMVRKWETLRPRFATSILPHPAEK